MNVITFPKKPVREIPTAPVQQLDSKVEAELVRMAAQLDDVQIEIEALLQLIQKGRPQ